MINPSSAAYDEWEFFQSFDDKISAELLKGELQAGGVPAEIHSAALLNGLIGKFTVAVPSNLAHRARWIVNQPPIEDGELVYMATGELPNREK